VTGQQIETHNIKTYKQYGTTSANIDRHICTQCKKPVSIDESMSNQGHNLICNKCVYRVCGSMEKAYK
jgi:uncharacterized CHY-type Zn-finger protein